ncbi:class I adenylate-forming enzyme family protein [Kocuria rosea]|uniref:class I adenylate-forming enzyme family protein n=1 Tax=Kocuria rosea TaxID=1275 RepID=UPI002541F188|nr:fatty acid--CoA ligase family protein [Kocuria rosea]WIG18092.1 fatty acid--CoA ligase family protein [Kocuria rosea]
MPFLDRLNRWAEERPRELAVACGDARQSWGDLRAGAAGLAASGDSTGMLRQANGTDFAVRWAAGVAEERVCAVLDPAWPDEPTEQVRERCAARLPAQPAPAELRDGDPASAFLIGLTSGTTALPKGFRRSRASWRRSFEASAAHFGLGPEDRVLAPGPLAASMNLYALSECLYAGAGFVTLPEFDVAAAHAAITGHGVTRLVLVPTVLRVLAERGLAAGVDASGVTAIVCAGQKLDATTFEAARRWAPHAAIWEYYGAAELGFVAARCHRPGEPAATTAEDSGTAVGYPFPGVEVAVLDHAGNPVPEGVTGTIGVRSDLVCDGYLWGDDGEAFGRLGGLHTVRDQGFLRNGRLHVLGRAAEMINTGGHNVYPHEVEAALALVPGVADVVVAGLPDDARGQRIVAGILPAAAGPDLRRIRAGLDGRLAPAKRPQQYWELRELPVTANGKLSRAVFCDWIREGDARVRPLG